MFQQFAITLKFESYIAEPYWPEREQIVNIEKQSGMNRARTDESRENKLRTFLQSQGISNEEYEALKVAAARPWYRANGDEDGPIVIPRHHMSGMLVQACTTAPAGARVSKEALRSLIRISDLVTEKRDRDCQFRRYVRPCDGTGKVLSNQRSLRESDVIQDFEAHGTLRIDTGVLKPENVRKLLVYAARNIGCGASRKMGYGRAELTEFAPDPTAEGDNGRGPRA